jgi:general secretion pathway protein E
MASTARPQPRSAPKLGELLLKHTSLSEPQLDEALAIQKAEGGLLGEILVRRNFLAQHEILRALCFQIGLPFADDLKPNEIDVKLVERIPINYAKSKEIIPVGRESGTRGETLIVAVADPFNEQTIDDLRVLIGMPVRLVVSTGSRIQDAINRVYERASAAFAAALNSRAWLAWIAT